MDPAHPLATIAQGTAEAHPEHRQHLAESPAIRTEHDADAQDHQPAGGGAAGRGLLPAPADLRQQVAARGAVLAEAACFTGAVEAHRRGVHQHSRGALELAHRLHQVVRAVQPAAEQLLPLVGGPALLGDRFAGQIHHSLRRGQGLAQPIVLPALRLGWIELQTHQPLPGKGGEGISLPAHQGEVVPELQQEGHQLPAHESRTAQKQQPHAQFMPSLQGG